MDFVNPNFVADERKSSAEVRRDERSLFSIEALQVCDCELLRPPVLVGQEGKEVLRLREVRVVLVRDGFKLERVDWLWRLFGCDSSVG